MYKGYTGYVQLDMYKGNKGIHSGKQGNPIKYLQPCAAGQKQAKVYSGNICRGEYMKRIHIFHVYVISFRSISNRIRFLYVRR